MTTLAIVLAIIGILFALVTVYSCMVVSGEWSEWEREQYRKETGREPDW